MWFIRFIAYEYYKRRIHDIITFCRTYDSFIPYCSYLESELIEEKIEIKQFIWDY